MAGILVFDSIAQGIRAGFEIYERNTDGILMRTRTPKGFALALVKGK